ncbi:MAG: response regulator transcription factor [Wenzhouxiangellaceae bacterium]
MDGHPIKLLAVEDDPGVQQRLRRCFADLPELAAFEIAPSIADAGPLLAAMRPDIVLLDVGLPDGNGLQLLLHPAVRADSVKTLVLTAFGDESTIVKAIELGAQGYLLKEEDDAELIKALHDIRQGIPPLSASVAQCILQQMRRTPPVDAGPALLKPLPPRQQQTLNLLARGMTYREIAGHMNITFHTVSTYAQEIYNKLAVKSRSEAVHRALELGIVQLGNSTAADPPL